MTPTHAVVGAGSMLFSARHHGWKPLGEKKMQACVSLCTSFPIRVPGYAYHHLTYPEAVTISP